MFTVNKILTDKICSIYMFTVHTILTDKICSIYMFTVNTILINIFQMPNLKPLLNNINPKYINFFCHLTFLYFRNIFPVCQS